MIQIKKNKSLFVLKIIILCLLFLFFMPYKKSAIRKDSTGIDSKMEESKFELPGERVYQFGQKKETGEAEKLESLFFLLKDGNTKPLIGFAFGDEFDYSLFNIGGYYDEQIRYQLKDSKYGGLHFLFNGKRMGFSGFIVHKEDDFFGINLEEISLEMWISIFGEPDSYEKKDDGEGMFATWYFEKASLFVRTKDEKIDRIEYIATGDAADSKEKLESQTEFGTDRLEEYDYIEDIYCWEAYGSVSNGSYACYHPYDENYEESQTGAFIENYLLSQGIYKKTPDGVSYNQKGYPLVEYYIEKEKNQYCFVVHLWGDYWVDYEKGIIKYRDAIYCTTYTLKKEDKVGHLIGNWNPKENTGRERLYDAQGKKMSDISYQYVLEMPFPFLTKYWNLNTEYELIGTVLCRNQKTWFYKEQTQFDEDGKLTDYNGSVNEKDSKEYFSYPSKFIYDADGRIKEIKEELQEYDIEMDWGWWKENIDYSGNIEFYYDENGDIKRAEYLRSSYLHGTFDSNGIIEYDEKGRMVYQDYYVTHGGDIDVFLYDENSDRPWACFCWCSFMPGFENIYLFQPVLS